MEAQRKENMLKDDMTELDQTEVSELQDAIDDSVLQKRPSNTRPSMRKSNIFLKERPSNGSEA